MTVKTMIVAIFLFILITPDVFAQNKTAGNENGGWVNMERQKQKQLLSKEDLNLVIENMAPSVEADVDLNFYVTDLSIIQKADSILSDTSVWNRQDDRICGDDVTTGKYSLYCALVKASIDISGEYLHRRTAMQETRVVIGQDFRSRFTQHRLMDFNNNPQTSFEDVKSVLKKAGEDIKRQLSEKEEILAIIHRFYTAVEKRDSKGMQNLFAKEAANHYLNNENGSVNREAQFPFGALQAKEESVIMKINGDATLKANDKIAIAWVPYDLQVNQNPFRQGMNVFILLKSNKGWLISSFSYTSESENY